MTVNVPGFDLRSYCNTAKRRQIATTSSLVLSSSSSRKAVGVPYIATSIASLIAIELILTFGKLIWELKTQRLVMSV
ncbi:hypothetical protein TNCT_359221 [Trichonephila clavata]|uniref:Uncharacterized protein n=1 Tax=Trichonephila clavata TaxID=2740835 RepID=A0A8X6LX43_TRICU|nr:hypothetical protein TNCT_359221 [Trichonephila clavata]